MTIILLMILKYKTVLGNMVLLKLLI